MKSLLCVLTLILPMTSHAFTCYLTFVKDTCWGDYDVTIEVVDSKTNSTLLQATVYEGKSYIRKTFECNPNQEITFHSTFSPLIWEKDKDKIYFAKQSTTLPSEIHPTDKAWTIDVCFPGQFSSVPTPPTANNQCQCDFKSIPPITL